MKITPALKTKVLNGGIYLTVRQLVAAALSLVSVLVIARVLGPERYGIVAIALSILYFTIWTGKLGLEVYLIRQPDLSEDGPEQVLAFYNTVGVALCVLLWLAVPIIGLWTGQNVVSQVLRWLVPVVWLEMVGSVSISMLERELRFAQIGLIEMLATAANYLLAVPLVLLNWGYWGPIAGLGLQFTVLALLGRYFYPIPWRWRWRWQFLGPALRYSLAYSGSMWGHNREVAKFHLWYMGLFWLACWLLLPIFGPWGYGAAEIVAMLSYVSIHRSLVKLCGVPNYWDGFWLTVATAPALLYGSWLPPALGFGTLAIGYGLLLFIRPSVRRIPKELYSALRSRKSALVP